MSKQINGYALNPMQLYAGSYTIIFSGIREKDKQNIIIKFLRNEHPSPDEIARFKHEYEIAKLFEAENDVVHVYELEKYDNGFAIIMENINGPTLSEVMVLANKLNLSKFLDLSIQITEALGHIHQNDVIHKDINPSNIMFDKNNKKIKIIDFGLSANLPKERVDVVNPNVLEGTLAYLSPEQTGRMNRGIDYRTDYYSLGVTFYQMLTGVLPFSSKDPMELVHFHIAVTPKTPHEIDPNIPVIISDIVMKLLAKKAEDRYQNANGIKADLINCQKQLLTTGKITEFPLGLHDIFSRFQIPEKLYGREQEVKTLMTSYEEAMQGSAKLVLVAGYSGIGKSALVHEIHKPIVQKHGYFISGKFDQFKHNTPYDAMVQALDGFVRQLLTEDEETIALFRENIINAVGNNGKLITDIIPNIVSIIGEQPPVVELNPSEGQHRFSYVFQKFIKSLASFDHPLVIFLDDLQWADLPSLKMIEILLTSFDCDYLLIIGAYRSNEVSSIHPLIMTLEDIKKHNVKVQTIDLGPLQLEDTNQLIADTVHKDLAETHALALTSYEKTAGNPFFLIQLLQSLYKEQIIKFDADENKWTWDIQKIRQKKITDNVVDLMLNKLKELTQTAQKALRYAACIGNQFDLNILSNLLKIDPEIILITLQEPLKEGYLLCHGESYRAVSYQFAHDRIQQAAHSLNEDNEKKIIHIELARLLLKSVTEEKLDEVIFDIANHYNMGIEDSFPEMIDQAEKRHIATLNLRASKVAKAAAAFKPALKYIECALKCMDDTAWSTEYDFMTELHIQAIETGYMSAQFDTMEKYSVIALQKITNITDELKIIKIKVFAFVAQTELEAAIDTVIKTSTRLGIKLPSHPTMAHILLTILKIKIRLIGKKVPDILNLPDMSNETIKSAIDLLSTAYAPSYLSNPDLFALIVSTCVNLSLRYGNTRQSAFPYATYGMICTGVLGEIDRGYEFGELGIHLIEKLRAEEAKTKVYMINYVFIKHWKDHLHNSLPQLIDNYKRGLDSGDIEYGSYSLYIYAIYSYFTGAPLKELESKLETYTAKLQELKQIQNFHYTSMLHEGIRHLLTKQKKPGFFMGEAYDETKMFPIHITANDKTALAFAYICKLTVSYLLDEYLEARECVTHLLPNEEALVSLFHIVIFHFYKSLTLLALYPTCEPKEKKFIRKSVAKSLTKIKKWAHYAPSNCTHKLLLIKAESAWRIHNKPDLAEKLFYQAIKIAKKNKFLNEEALGNELAAKLYLALDNEKIARLYLEDAYHCYQVWGADAKVALLDAKYPQLLTRAKNVEPIIANSAAGTSTIGSESSLYQMLDMGTIQKSSQAISSTIILEDLLNRLMRIVIENAGAQKSFLILSKNGQYVIEAEANIDNATVDVLKSIPISNFNLPLSVINYVSHSKESLVLDNAKTTPPYSTDSYVLIHGSKSVLCMPLLNQRKLSGILYMENNLIEGAFSKDRINILNLLSSQIAMSIDNARLYSNTKALNEQLITLVDSYERFVPKDFLSLLEKESIVDVGLGDQVEKTMSVLFVDIRNSTTLSEKMDPQENFNFINTFLSVMCPIIRKHNGFVDKYIGDAIMALYPRNADDAIQCSLEMMQALIEFNQIRENEGKEAIAIGIGINTGSLMLGTVGEEGRMNATVISDAVNVASRVESLTKVYKAPILITEHTYKDLKNPARYLIEIVDDQVIVKGKTKSIAIYKVEELKDSNLPYL